MDVLELLDQLVRIDSVNPGLDPDGAGEAEIAEFVAGWGHDAQLRVQLIEQTAGRPSVILRGGRDTGGRRLLLCGHLDTVGLAGNHDLLTPHVDGDRLYGRGAYDMKAGLAAALVACRDAQRSGIDGEVVVAAVADEEHASVGIQQVLAQLDPTSIAAAVVTEPTERDVGTAHRGFIWTEVDRHRCGRPRVTAAPRRRCHPRRRASPRCLRCARPAAPQPAAPISWARQPACIPDYWRHRGIHHP